MAAQYGANAGAAIGTAIAPGVGTAVGGLLGSLLDGGSVAGSGSMGPMTSQSAVYGSGLDGSGWAVNFSGTQTATSTANKAAGIVPPEVAGLSLSGGGMGASLNLGGSIAGIPKWVFIVAIGVIVWKKSKSKK